MVTEQDVSEYGCSFHSVVLVVKCTKHVDDSCFSVCGISAANVTHQVSVAALTVSSSAKSLLAYNAKVSR